MRRVLAWEETLRISKPLAKVLDFAAERKFGQRVSLRYVFIEIPHLAEESVELQRTSVTTWPPFIVKVDALSLGESAPENLTEPAQTIVDSGRLDFSATHVQQIAWGIYELLGGVKTGSDPSTSTFTPRLNPVANLSEMGNTICAWGRRNRPGLLWPAIWPVEAAELHKQSLAAFHRWLARSPQPSRNRPLSWLPFLNFRRTASRKPSPVCCAFYSPRLACFCSAPLGPSSAQISFFTSRKCPRPVLRWAVSR